MVEIFLFPVRVRGGSRLHLSTTHPAAAAARCQPSGTQLAGSAGSSKVGSAHGAGEWQTCSAQLALLTLSSGPSEKELAPRSSPSWPGAPGCHVSGREKCKGKAWNRLQWFCLQPWVFPHPEPLPGQHLGCLHKTAVMEGPPSVSGKQPASSHSWEIPTQHSSHLEKGETHIILKDDAANTPHITGLAPAKL